MDESGSVTLWLRELKKGDRDKIQNLWQRYFHRLVGFARQRLQGLPPAVGDEEQVALSAFKTFWRRAELGEFPDLADRQGLWELLLLLTNRKAKKLRKHETRQKRDYRRTKHGESASPEVSCGEKPFLVQLISQEPDPHFAATIADQCQHLMMQLTDAELRTIAWRKLEGYTNKEIAAQLDCSLATIERRLTLIRASWEEEPE